MMDFVIMRRGKGDGMNDAISRKDAINALKQGFKGGTKSLHGCHCQKNTEVSDERKIR